LEKVEKAYALDPLDELVLQLRAMVKSKLGRESEGLADLDALVAATQSKNAKYLAMRGNARFDVGMDLEALADLDAAIALDPTVPLWIFLRSVIKCELKEMMEAFASAERAIALDPEEPLIVHWYGKLRFKMFKDPESLAFYDRALAMGPNNHDKAVILHDRAKAKQELGKDEEALDDLEIVLDLEPGNAEALYLRGLVMAKLGRLEAAAADVEAADALRTVEVNALMVGGSAKAALGRLEEALAMLNRAHVADPESAEILYRRRLVYEALGDEEKAWEDAERILVLRKADLKDAEGA
jgi:tetratricopeptide (TPR) repeat protein